MKTLLALPFMFILTGCGPILDSLLSVTPSDLEAATPTAAKLTALLPFPWNIVAGGVATVGIVIAKKKYKAYRVNKGL